jgi:hypothetical protein
MKNQKDEKWLDEQIARVVNSKKVKFDPERWKQKYPEEYQMLISNSIGASKAEQPGICLRFIKSPVAKLTAAAVIIFAAVLFTVNSKKEPQIRISRPDRVSSPAKIISLFSLNNAYRRGGVEALESQLEKSAELLGPGSADMDIKELF